MLCILGYMEENRNESWCKWPAIFCGVSFVLGMGAGFLIFGERGFVAQETIRMHADSKFATISLSPVDDLEDMKEVYDEIRRTAVILGLHEDGKFVLSGNSEDADKRTGTWSVKDGGYELKFDGKSEVMFLNRTGSDEVCDYSWRNQGVVVCYVHP
jgi:hypothetical protein